MKLYYSTVLSNLRKGLNRATLVYSKDQIKESTFTNQFYLTTKEDLNIGINKATKLLAKLSLPCDKVIILETDFESSQIKKNERTGLGVFIEQNWIQVHGFLEVSQEKLIQLNLDEVLTQMRQLKDLNQHSYAEYRKEKEDLLKTDQSLLRLDCMNPYKKIGNICINTLSQFNINEKPGTSSKIIRYWTKQTQVQLPHEVVLSSGVRESLKSIYNIFKGRTVWLPEDVYPVYLELAKGLMNVRTFNTYPNFNLNFLKESGVDDLLILPNPLSPAGRFLSASEIEALKQWLLAGKNRTLVLDQVYNYTHNAEAYDSLPIPQTITIWALSKAWLLESSLAINCIPKQYRKEFKSNVLQPTQEEIETIYRQLNSNDSLPGLQAELYERQWKVLEPKIKKIVPDWQAPEIGYFSFVNKSYTSLLAQGVMAIPASVFGHSRSDVSVITCLYNIFD